MIRGQPSDGIGKSHVESFVVQWPSELYVELVLISDDSDR